MAHKHSRAYLKAPARPDLDPMAPAAPRDLAVLVVAYKNPDLTHTCLTSVATHLPGCEILVIDNSGPDFDGIRALAERWPDATWVLGGDNIGFAAGVNRLAELVPDKDMLLLNPDAVLLGPLDRTRALLHEPGVAAAAPLVLDDNPGIRPWDVAHAKSNLVRSVLNTAGYADRLRGTWFSDLYSATPDVVTGYLTGACLAIRRDAWDHVGPFDEEYFLYGEEGEWQHRAQRAGWTLRLGDETGISHSAGGTVSADSVASTRSTDLLRGNTALSIEHGHGPALANAYVASTALLDRLQRSARQQRAAVLRARGDIAPSRRAKPSVIFTTNTLWHGGAERHHVILAGELGRRGYDVSLVCLQRFGPLAGETPSGVRLVRLPWWLPAVDTVSDRAVVFTAESNTESGFGRLWRSLPGGTRRWVSAIHLAPHEDGAPRFSAPLAKAMSTADGVVALSDRCLQLLTSRQSLGRRTFIAPNGVMRRDEMGAARPTLARREPRPDNEPLHLVVLSRMSDGKNPRGLLEALARMPEMPWRVSIFGDGPKRAEFEAQTPDSIRDRICWAGWSPGPDHALVDADVFCVPSRAEAFPLVILEAASRGLPVLATPVGAIPDILDHGRAGHLTTGNSPDDWEATLRWLFAQDRQDLLALGMAGFDRTAERYTVEAMADAYESVIEAVFHPDHG